MAKHRKTRKEKIRSENRQEHVFASPSEKPVPLQEKRSFSFTFTPDKQISTMEHASTNLSTAHEYAFVMHDLLKTSAVVGSIVITELLLFVFIH